MTEIDILFTQLWWDGTPVPSHVSCRTIVLVLFTEINVFSWVRAVPLHAYSGVSLYLLNQVQGTKYQVHGREPASGITSAD